MNSTSQNTVSIYLYSACATDEEIDFKLYNA